MSFVSWKKMSTILQISIFRGTRWEEILELLSRFATLRTVASSWSWWREMVNTPPGKDRWHNATPMYVLVYHFVPKTHRHLFGGGGKAPSILSLRCIFADIPKSPLERRDILVWVEFLGKIVDSSTHQKKTRKQRIYEGTKVWAFWHWKPPVQCAVKSQSPWRAGKSPQAVFASFQVLSSNPKHHPESPNPTANYITRCLFIHLKEKHLQHINKKAAFWNGLFFKRAKKTQPTSPGLSKSTVAGTFSNSSSNLMMLSVSCDDTSCSCSAKLKSVWLRGEAWEKPMKKGSQKGSKLRGGSRFLRKKHLGIHIIELHYYIT